MKRQSVYFSLFYLSLLSVSVARGQTDTTAHVADSIQRLRIAVFVPLYLDSAFDSTGTYRYDKNFPKFFSPGLEFYEGLQLAVDSLQATKMPLDVDIFDTRSAVRPIARVLQDSGFNKTSLILGYISTAAEMRQLAQAAEQMRIPFINVNFPNDVGIRNNPEFVILNSTLKTHCEALYKFIQRNYPTYNLIFLTKKGAQEDRLKNYFTDIEKNTASVPLKLKYAVLNEPVDSTQLIQYLDADRKNICIVGSLDESFGKNICAQLAAINNTYVSKIFGMPTWDAIDFSGQEYTGQEIYYTTPFYINPNDSLVTYIQEYFKNKYYSRPSDMVFRGYETMFRFAQLLQLYGNNLSGSIGEKKFKVFDDFDIEPVFLDRQNMTLDYFENRKIYFIKKVNGNIVAVY